MGRTERGWPTGVEPLHHTADVGLRARADSLSMLFNGLAAGMCVMVEGEGRKGSESSESQRSRRTLDLVASDLPLLLVAWLRELLHLHQVDGLAFSDAEIESLDDTTLRATVSLRPARRDPVREIKGVTYHGLQAAKHPDGWHARVIFDV